MDALIADVLGDVVLVLVISWLAGSAARKLGQPAVVGQILAGILMGPTLLGRLPGHLTQRLFTHEALPFLSVLAQIAVTLFMFVVGYEIDWRSLRGRQRAAPLVAVSALAVPMALGAAAVLAFRSRFEALGQAHLSHSFVLFMGLAVAITALPVLAAITRERGIAASPAAMTATAAAGLMDVAAWIVLAAILVGTSQGSHRRWPVTLLLAACFLAVLLLLVGPALRWVFSRRQAVLASQLPVALALTLACAWATASLGLHPIFGGFAAGIVMRGVSGEPDAAVLQPMERMGGLFLPLFFVVTGLSLNVGALGGDALVVLLVVCVVATAGKLVPAYLASRAGGLGHRDAATVAVLVDARGLTELIALNVGLSAGLIDRQLFTVLVGMALLTTIITSWLLSLIGAPEPPALRPAPEVAPEVAAAVPSGIAER